MQYDDLYGKKFGRLTVMSHGCNGRVKCLCDCGTEKYVHTWYLRNGFVKSCGCLHEESIRKPKVDMTGRKCGRWTVVEYVGRGLWKCVCDCGNIRNVSGGSLRNGASKSCGYYKAENDGKHALTHGESRTRLYKIWRGIKERCYDKNRREYANYGGRGIRMCDSWRESYECFRDWANANGYDVTKGSHECTIDRIDNDGDYCPENCRWVDSVIQNNNMRKRKHVNRQFANKEVAVDLIDADGKIVKTYKSITDAAHDTGCSAQCISRVCRGIYRTTNGGMRWQYSSSNIPIVSSVGSQD